MRGNRRGIVYMVLILAVLGGIYLYTELQSQMATKPPELKAFVSDEMQKEAQMGTYEWNLLDAVSSQTAIIRRILPIQKKAGLQQAAVKDSI